MINYIYDKYGSAVAYVQGRYIYSMRGNAVGANSRPPMAAGYSPPEKRRLCRSRVAAEPQSASATRKGGFRDHYWTNFTIIPACVRGMIA